MSRILIVTPGTKVRHSGNRCTASQWAEILRRQGHRVVVCYDVPDVFPAAESDLLLAMHAVRCAGVIGAYRATFPRGKVLLALTGTDIYPEPSATALASMRAADGLIVLQGRAMEKVPPDCRGRASVVIQSATPRVPVRTTARRADDPFDVCVVGHFRDVKDPLLTACASRLVPPASRLRVRQAGGILEASYAALVAREQRENPRYEWLGELSVDEVAGLMAGSDLMALTSRHEGGARVVGEAIVHGTPVLSTRIDGVVGLLGDDYPGFFPAGDAAALAGLLWRSESDPEFMAELRRSALERRARFAPEAEDRALAAAVRKIFATHAPA